MTTFIKSTLMQMEPAQLVLVADTIPTEWLEEYTKTLIDAAIESKLDTISMLVETLIYCQWQMVVDTRGRGNTSKAVKRAKIHLHQLQHMHLAEYLRKHGHSSLAALLIT